MRGARIASNELTEVLVVTEWVIEYWRRRGDSVGVGVYRRGEGVWRRGEGVIAMIYGVSDRWGSANGRVGGIAFGDSRIDFRTPKLITYK